MLGKFEQLGLGNDGRCRGLCGGKDDTRTYVGEALGDKPGPRPGERTEYIGIGQSVDGCWKKTSIGAMGSGTRPICPLGPTVRSTPGQKEKTAVLMLIVPRSRLSSDAATRARFSARAEARQGNPGRGRRCRCVTGGN